MPECAGTALKERAVSWRKENTLRTRRLLCRVPKRLHQTSEEAGDTFSFIFFFLLYTFLSCRGKKNFFLSKLWGLDDFRQQKQQQPQQSSPCIYLWTYIHCIYVCVIVFFNNFTGRRTFVQRQCSRNNQEITASFSPPKLLAAALCLFLRIIPYIQPLAWGKYSEAI